MPTKSSAKPLPNNPIQPPGDLSQCLFIVWPGAFDQLDRIRADLAGSFRILADIKVHWSEQHVQNNLRRLYRQPVTPNINPNYTSPKATRPVLQVFYVENQAEEASLHASATWEIERLNGAFPLKKELYRQWALEGGTEYPYLVHSAAQLEELRFQTVLLLGPERAGQLWAGKALGETELHRDLTGAEDWGSLREAFDALDHSVRWCVLRGWEDLPDNFSSNDLDILVDNPKNASSALGLLHKSGKGDQRTGLIQLSGSDIVCDLHWIGDGYLDPVWQNNMLTNRALENNVFRPDSEDAFFSLIYSEYVHRQNERPEKIARLQRVSHELSHTGWLTDDLFEDRGKVLKILAGYMKVRGYYWVQPLYKRYPQPEDALAALPKPNVPPPVQPKGGKGSFLMRLSIRLARRLLPAPMRQALRKLARR